MELGFMEMVVIALAIIVLFGPDKLPSIARDLGSGVRKMKGAMEDIKTEILKETHEPVSEIKREIQKVKDAARESSELAEFNKEIKEVKESSRISLTNDTNASATSSNTAVEPKESLAKKDDPLYEGPVSR